MAGEIGGLKKSTMTVSGILACMTMPGCAEVAEVLLPEMQVSYGLNWIVQEWDNPGWSTHNSDQYETVERCNHALAEQLRQNPERGYRCIHEGDLIGK